MMGFHEQGRLVPSSVYGCRRWVVFADGTLWSYSAGYQWKSGWQTARCHQVQHHLGNPRANYGKYCGCGFWAYWNERGEHVRFAANSGNVAGIIEGKGDAVVGNSGFRISQARIVALIVPPLQRTKWLFIVYCVAWAIYFIVFAVVYWNDHQLAFSAAFGAVGGAMLGVGVVALFKLPVSPRRKIQKHYPDVKFYNSWKAAYKDFPVEVPTWKGKR